MQAEGGALVLPQTSEWEYMPAPEHRFLKNSAKGQRLLACRSHRLNKNLCRSSQVSFTIPQKKEKEKNIYSLTSFQTQTESY